MAYVDFILNLAAVLIWAKWRSLPFDPFNKRTPATLVGTLRRAAPSHFRRWHLLAAIIGLLILRAFLYRWVGPAFTPVWVGKLNLGVTMLPFRSDFLARMLTFSFLSFGMALGIFYWWLLLLTLLNGKSTAAEPMQRLVRMQLGGIDGWPRWVKLVSPFTVTALVWWLTSWPLTWLEIIPRPLSFLHRLEESLVIGLGSYLVWKILVLALLVLRLLNTYVYFGKHPFWNYVNTTALTLFAPLQKVPLRVGKVDLAPIVGMVLVFLAAEVLEHSLIWLYSRLPL